METRRVLIADSTEDFRTALAEELSGSCQVRTCGNGKHTLELIQTFCPDVLVLDLMIPGLDGISLLQTAFENGMQAQVLATTRYVSDYVAESLGRLGVGYLMVKPCDVKATVERILDLAQQPQRQQSAIDRRADVSAILFLLGIPTKLRGHAYLREAILSLAKDPDQSITKELYPEVAAACNGTPSQIERSIRGAITSAWKNRNDAQWKRYFGLDREGNVPKPTNADFISRIADVLAVSGNLNG